MYQQIEQFYKENYNLLVKRLTRRAGNPENAEDVLQDAFERALKYHKSFNPERQEIGAWFNTIMNNVLVRHQREQMQGGATIPYDEFAHEESYECTAEIKSQVESILGHMYKKEEDAKNVLHLYFINGFRMFEIREITSVPYSTIQMMIHRFKLEMAKEYSDELQEG
jgi:RNA polymerase sigma factor (sigma-70 family)